MAKNGPASGRLMLLWAVAMALLGFAFVSDANNVRALILNLLG